MIEISDEMKLATWALFDRARSIDPSKCVPGTRQFISHLANVMRKAEIRDFDKELTQCRVTADEAWYHFAHENDWGEAYHLCLATLDKIGHLAFDDRFSKPDERPFSAPMEVKT